ncbi:MAG: GtrA family protein [bacterium]|nr:GtrA family protein [bacterium]
MIINNKKSLWATLDQLIKYVCIGAISVATDIIFLYFFTEFFNLWYVLSAGLSFLIGLIIVFVLNKFWSFQKYAFTKEQLKKFIILMAFNYLSNMLLILLLTEIVEITYLSSKLIIIAMQTIWNFLLYKFWVFKK